MNHVSKNKRGNSGEWKEGEKDHVQFPLLENVLRPETPSWVPLARRASFAWEPISCVWLAEGSVCICVCVCVRARALGVAVQRGLGLFCLPGEERNAQIKHSEQDAWRKRRDGGRWGGSKTIDSEEKDGETQEVETQKVAKRRSKRGEGASEEKEGEDEEARTPKKNRARDRFFIHCQWGLEQDSSCAICISAEWQSGVSIPSVSWWAVRCENHQHHSSPRTCRTCPDICWFKVLPAPQTTPEAFTRIAADYTD